MITRRSQRERERACVRERDNKVVKGRKGKGNKRKKIKKIRALPLEKANAGCYINLGSVHLKVFSSRSFLPCTSCIQMFKLKLDD